MVYDPIKVMLQNLMIKFQYVGCRNEDMTKINHTKSHCSVIISRFIFQIYFNKQNYSYSYVSKESNTNKQLTQ